MSGKHEARSGHLTDGSHFCGEWKVVTGDIGHEDPQNPQNPEYLAMIEIVNEVQGDFFGLTSCRILDDVREEKYAQALVFDPKTGMLTNRPGEKPERRVAFWDRESIHGGKNCIFAMRRNDPKTPGEKIDLLPWESVDPNGSWGAEGG